MHGNADLGLWVRGLEHLPGARVGTELVMYGVARRVDVANARRVRADEMSLLSHDERLVEGYPVTHPITKPPDHHRDVISEPLGHVGIRPSPASLKGGRKVPVIEGDEGFDVSFQ